MKAIVVKPGVKDSIHMRDMPDPKLKADQVAVKMVRVGLCGTDAEINHGLYGKAPEGDEYLILGHENFGVVEEVGKNVKGFKAGDLVVSTVRRPCKCHTCKAGENDMCQEGAYQERGIMGRHGFMAQYYVESPQWLNKIPKTVGDIGVLLEPMSVVEKGLDHAYLMQQRLEWKPKTGLVLGGGPIGLLAAAVMRARGLDTHVVGRETEDDLRAQLAKKMGAKYHCLVKKTVLDVHKEIPPIDIAIEATGVATVAFHGMQVLGRNGVLCLLSVTGGSKSCRSADRKDQPAARPWQSGRVRQCQRQSAAFCHGREGFHDYRKEMAGCAEAAHHDTASVGSVQQLVRSAGIWNKDDAGDFLTGIASSGPLDRSARSIFLKENSPGLLLVPPSVQNDFHSPVQRSPVVGRIVGNRLF